VIRILFVCTGNICRSPTAEALARIELAELGDRVSFASAGLAALDGAPASTFAAAAAAETGVDLRRHAAAGLTPEAASRADRIYVMTRRQQRDLLDLDPDLASRVELLDPDGVDVDDPYGYTMEDYRRSRDHIADGVSRRAAEWRALVGGA
jgi:protein-tyrosine phosphatase